MARLNGKVAVITGAAGGIGKTAAKLFVREGAQVMLVDRDAEALRALCTELGPRARFSEGDVSHPGDNARCTAAAVEHFGGVDILFANAGIEGTVCPLTELSPEVFERVFSVNVMGVFLGIKYAAPEMEKRGGGSVIITSSVAGMVASPGLGAYVTSKHALSGLARTAALELASQRIRVNTIHPGPIDNRMMRSIEGQASPDHAEDVKQAFEAKIALGRYGTNEEIAQLALFLASNESSYCTGSQFVADGGYTAQ